MYLSTSYEILRGRKDPTSYDPTCICASVAQHLNGSTYELTQAERKSLRILDLESGWSLKLTKRFVSRISEALTAFDSPYFSKGDVMDGRCVYTFAHKVLQCARAAQIESEIT